MRRLKLNYILVPIALFFGTQLSWSQDLETVLNKCSESLQLGSRKNITALQTEGYFIMRDTEAKIPFKFIQSRPEKLRIETSVFGFKAIQTYDGVNAWLLSPTQGLEARKVSSKEMEFITLAAGLDGPFTLYPGEKYSMVYGGRDKYLDEDVELVIYKAENEKLKFYISINDFRIPGIRYEYKKNGAWYSMEYRIREYQEFEGSIFPREITGVVNGVEMVYLYVNKLKSLNSVDPDTFGKPTFSN